MIWFWWWEYDLPGQPDLIFDPERSGFKFYNLSEPGEETRIAGPIQFEVGRRTVASLARFSILPATQFPLVRGAALQEFQALPEDEVAFHATNIACRDGEVDDFVLVRPKIQCQCADIEKSDIEWVREGEFYVMWKRLAALPDSCMGGRSIVRDSLNRMIVVSDPFKARIEKLAVKAVAFTAVEGSRSGFADWVP
ncbi:MAG: hypothetical protein KDE06_16360 [Rhodobacteraceae bacterium]|nr:hypothetical protein [Paracoccaceae bacterium]MCB2152545.1 hypothetical protein [Paracoccaceae bacterium]MCB2158697.1 hypothetical protein [Paracoccaceae bacterium]MCP5375657.1 hypothetical protein [Paracoccaceae bacterium]